jgi:plasmid stability protein
VTDFLIRDVDEDVMRRLKERAQRHGRSLQQEVHEVLANAARPTADEIKRVFEEFDAKHERIPADVDITEIVREERDNRGWK